MLDLEPKIIENSPVLQRWQRQVPNVLEDINNDPSSRTRVRVGYNRKSKIMNYLIAPKYK